jgi:hypothetical protein
MNREEMARLMAMHKAAAGALERALKSAARQEQEAGNGAPTWRLKAARVTGNVSHDKAVCVDAQAFLDWMRVRYPDSVVQVYEPRNPQFVNDVRESLSRTAERDEDGRPTGRILDAEGSVVPGLVFERGGTPLNASITLNPAHTPALVAAAMLGVETGDWTALWAYAEEADVDRVLSVCETIAASADRPADATESDG